MLHLAASTLIPCVLGNSQHEDTGGTARSEQASVPLQVMHREQGWDGCGPWRGPRQLSPCLPHLHYHLLPRLRCPATGLQRVSLADQSLAGIFRASVLTGVYCLLSGCLSRNAEHSVAFPGSNKYYRLD